MPKSSYRWKSYAFNRQEFQTSQFPVRHNACTATSISEQFFTSDLEKSE